MGVILRNAAGELDLPYGNWDWLVQAAVLHGWKPRAVKAPLAVVREANGDLSPVWAERPEDRWYPSDVHQCVSAEDALGMAVALERAEQESEDSTERGLLERMRALGLPGFPHQGGFETIPYDSDSPDRYRDEWKKRPERTRERDPARRAQGERVRSLIRQAFGQWRVRPKEARRARQWYRYLRDNLPMLPAADVPKELPGVLEDLLDYHSEDPVETEGAEQVLSQLNVLGRKSPDYYQRMAQIFGEGEVENDRRLGDRLRAARLEQFALLTQEQSRVIAEWLLHARSWGCFEFRQEDLDAALDYWKQRAGHPQAGPA